MISGQPRSPMHERIQPLSRNGRQILFVDLSNCGPRLIEEVMRKLPDVLTTQAPGSAFILTDFTGASFDADAIMAMKEAAVFNKPYVKRSALVGTQSLPKHVYDGMKNFALREWGIFQSRTDAIAWLVEE